MSVRIVAALYRFVGLPDYCDLREPLQNFCRQWDIKGSLLLAHEGINGTVSGTREAIDALVNYLQQDQRFIGLEYKESQANIQPFKRMLVKLKKEIVTLGIEDINPNKTVGTYVVPQDWNRLIADPEVILIDTRNDYEVRLGTFVGAQNPETQSFRELPNYVASHLDPSKHKKVAMFCTGGIRCEKSTAYLKHIGFDQVFHLKGGILKYLEEVPEEQSLWRGECFVFDNRVTVNHRLEKGSYLMCHSCGMPVSPEEAQSEHYIEELSCPHCYHLQTPDQKARFTERKKQIELTRLRAEKGQLK
jgi:UPF0176 protein